MGKDEKSKTPFQDYIESLDKMNGIGHLIVVSATASIIDEVIRNYGLPEDAETIRLLKLTETNWKFLSQVKLPPMVWAYIKVLMWQVAVDNNKPLDATLTAFMWGFAFGATCEINID